MSQFSGTANPSQSGGVTAIYPMDFYKFTRDPTPNDTRGVRYYRLGDHWENTINYNLWYLAALKNNVATWILMTNSNGPILAINNDVGNVLPANGLINLFATPNAGHTVAFVGSGNTINLNTTDIIGNTAIGLQSGANLIPTQLANSNTLLGQGSGKFLSGNSSGLASSNVLIGFGAGFAMTTGSSNTGIGTNVFRGGGGAAGVTTGNGNIAIGNFSGASYTGAESQNILLSNFGIVGESFAIHIGSQGQHTSATLAGVYGTSVGATPSVVIADSTGKLGTAAGAYADWTSWTPTLVGETTAGTTTYVYNNGSYTRLGNSVTVTFAMQWTGATGTGNVNIGGLPFSSVNIANLYWVGAINFGSNGGFPYPAGCTSLAIELFGNSNFLRVPCAGSSIQTTVGILQMNNAQGACRGTITYQIA